MTEVVLDASVIFKWFHTEGEPHLDAATSLRTQFESGELIVFVPRLLALEILNVAGRRWKWAESALKTLAEALGVSGLQFREPELEYVAKWTARGLTAYDASYVALAESEGMQLITDDAFICATAPGTAISLASVRA